MEELEQLVYTDRHARKLHNALLWPWPPEVLLALYECDFDGVPASADAGMYKESSECFRGWGVVMEHRTLVQRRSQSVQREPCSPIEQPGYVAQDSQLLFCGGLWESTLGCAA